MPKKLFQIGLAIAEPGQSRMRGVRLVALIGELKRLQLTCFQLSKLRISFFLSWRTMRHEGRIPSMRSEYESINQELKDSKDYTRKQR
jgi:hypothetical protein